MVRWAPLDHLSLWSWPFFFIVVSQNAFGLKLSLPQFFFSNRILPLSSLENSHLFHCFMAIFLTVGLFVSMAPNVTYTLGIPKITCLIPKAFLASLWVTTLAANGTSATISRLASLSSLAMLSYKMSKAFILNNMATSIFPYQLHLFFRFSWNIAPLALLTLFHFPLPTPPISHLIQSRHLQA